MEHLKGSSHAYLIFIDHGHKVARVRGLARLEYEGVKPRSLVRPGVVPCPQTVQGQGGGLLGFLFLLQEL